MKLNHLEFWLMNNPVRAWSQRSLETPILIRPPDALIGQCVLEIGCGRGVGIEILLRGGAAHVTGFDIDPAMIALAHQRITHYGDWARVFVGDAEAIDSPDARFDSVIDYGILHHVPGWPQALMGIARVLKPGGQFYFEDLLKGFISAPVVRSLLDHPQATQFFGKDFRAALESAGLHVVRWKQFGEWVVIGQAVKDPQTSWSWNELSHDPSTF